MRSLAMLPLVGAALVLVLGLDGCEEHVQQSLAKTGAAIKAQGAKLDAAPDDLTLYIGERFSEAEKALANKREEDVSAPTF
jgi:hypothetical protein